MREPHKFPKVLTGVMIGLLGTQRLTDCHCSILTPCPSTLWWSWRSCVFDFRIGRESSRPR